MHEEEEDKMHREGCCKFSKIFSGKKELVGSFVKLDADAMRAARMGEGNAAVEAGVGAAEF